MTRGLAERVCVPEVCGLVGHPLYPGHESEGVDALVEGLTVEELLATASERVRFYRRDWLMRGVWLRVADAVLDEVGK
jgi:hypothetical protein